MDIRFASRRINGYAGTFGNASLRRSTGQNLQVLLPFGRTLTIRYHFGVDVEDGPLSNHNLQTQYERIQMRTHATWMLALTLVASPTLGFGADSAATASAQSELKLQNVELTSSGSLKGQLVTNAGQPVSNVTITVRSQSGLKKVDQQLTTDEDGRFQATGLKTGTLVLQADKETYAVRVWNAGTAPPKSISTIALVQSDGQEVVRGNQFTDRIRGLSRRQQVGLGLLVAGAIIIPIALQDAS